MKMNIVLTTGIPLLAIVSLGSAGLYVVQDKIDYCYFVAEPVFNVTNPLKCAATCQSLKCTFFNLTGNECQLYDVGTDSNIDLSPRTYYKMTTSIITRNKTTGPAMQWGKHVSGYANDGDPSTQYHSLQVSPYWYVDLGHSYIIQRIQILPTPTRFNNVEVRAGLQFVNDGDFSSFQLIQFVTSANSWFDVIPATPTCGRYLSFQRVDGWYLNIRELEVFVGA